MAQMEQTIFFLYNANGGVLNGALDSLHKFISPSTYPCSLCELTHGYFGERENWKAFAGSLKEKGFKLRGIHKDELGDWPVTFTQLPAVYLYFSGSLTILLSPMDLKKLTSTDQLIHRLDARLLEFNTLSGSSRA